jgi:hypothetical protein
VAMVARNAIWLAEIFSEGPLRSLEYFCRPHLKNNSWHKSKKTFPPIKRKHRFLKKIKFCNPDLGLKLKIIL